MRDLALRKVSLWIAGISGVLASAAFAIPHLQFITSPATFFVAGVATVLFLKMLFSRFYRDGVEKARRAMQGSDPWPGQPKSFSDPEWGLFGTKWGSRPLLWVRNVLVMGVLPVYFVQHWTGVEAGWLWFAAACVATELSLMHLAIDAQEQAA